jgi:hypothetical protein
VIDQQLRGSKGEVNMHGHCMEAVDLIGMMMSAGPVMLVMEYYMKGARASTLGKHQKWKHKHQMIITDKIRHEYIRLNFHNVPAGLDINQGNKRGPIISSTTDKVYRKRN